MIAFEDKTKFKIKDERYCIIAQHTNYNVTCVFNTKKTSHMYKTGNLFHSIGIKTEKKMHVFFFVHHLCINFLIFSI